MTALQRRVENNVVMEGATMIFRNFTGREGQYNREGDRNFCVLLPEEVAGPMFEDGWNVKRLKPRDDEEVGTPYIHVAVEFRKGRPPQVVLITSRGRTDLGAEEVEILDYLDIANVDLIIRPYNYNVNGSVGVKAYLKDMFVTMEETVLDRKYADVRRLDRADQPLEIASTPHEDDMLEGEVLDDEDDFAEAVGFLESVKGRKDA